MKEATSGVHKVYRRDNQPFAQIPNEAIRNPEITANGFRLLAYLMSHQDGYELTYAQIERQTGLGRYAINEAIKNLTAHKWLETDRPKLPNGQYGPKSWIVHNPTSASFSTVGDSTVEQPTDYKKNTVKEEHSREKSNAQQVEREFDVFWQNYPRKVGKGLALKTFAKLTAEDQQRAIVGVLRLANDPNLPAKAFIPHPGTWLNEQRWFDEPYPERQLSADEKKQQELALLEHRRERERLASERERLERQRIEDEAKANPAPRCAHDRIVYLCRVCSPK